MALYDLCALGDVKAWLGRTDTNSDAVLSSLITRASRQLYSYLQRGLILPRGVTETRDGTGGDAIVLRQWPVISIAALQIGGQTIAQAPSGCGAGWTLEAWDGTPPGGPQRLTVTGYSFGLAFPGANNTQNIEIAYRAGYQVSVEPNLVANSSAIVLAPYGGWASDAGVVYAQPAGVMGPAHPRPRAPRARRNGAGGTRTPPVPGRMTHRRRACPSADHPGRGAA